MLRSVIAFALFGGLVSCAGVPSGPPVARAQPGDPGLDGRDYLISEADFRAILAVGQQNLQSLFPRERIHLVTVLSQTMVNAYYGNMEEAVLRCLVIEKLNGQWRVTGTDTERNPIAFGQRVIVT